MDSCLRALKRCVDNNHSKLLWLNDGRESSVKPFKPKIILPTLLLASAINI